MFRLTALRGTFDIIHVGHVRLIEKDVSISEKIIIGLTSDEFISEHVKQINNNFEQRFENLRKITHENFS
jgi:cytidyltransferase-related domain